MEKDFSSGISSLYHDELEVHACKDFISVHFTLPKSNEVAMQELVHFLSEYFFYDREK